VGPPSSGSQMDNPLIEISDCGQPVRPSSTRRIAQDDRWLDADRHEGFFNRIYASQETWSAAGIHLALAPSPLPAQGVVLVFMNGRWQVRHRCRLHLVLRARARGPSDAGRQTDLRRLFRALDWSVVSWVQTHAAVHARSSSPHRPSHRHGLAGRGVDSRQSIWKPDYSLSFGAVRTNLGSVKGHYRMLAVSKHPFHRTLFGTPRTGMGHPAVHSTANMSLDAPVSTLRP